MEFSEQTVEFKLCVIKYELRPVVAGWQRLVVALEVVNDLGKVPREGQDVGVLGLVEAHVNTKTLVFLVNVQCVLLSLLHFNLGGESSLLRGQEAGNHRLGEETPRVGQGGGV